MKTLAQMKSEGMTLVEMLDAATEERLDARVLESLCAEASAEIRRLFALRLEVVEEEARGFGDGPDRL